MSEYRYYKSIKELFENSNRAVSNFDVFYDLGNPCKCLQAAEDNLIQTLIFIDRVKDLSFYIMHEKSETNKEIQLILIDIYNRAREVRDLIELLLADNLCNSPDICAALGLVRRTYIGVGKINTLAALVLNLSYEEAGEYFD